MTRESYESISHPDLKGDAGVSYSIAALLYRIITGAFPFTGAGAEEMHEQARKLEINAPSAVVPELSAEVSALVMAGLGKGGAARRDTRRMGGQADGLAGAGAVSRPFPPRTGNRRPAPPHRGTSPRHGASAGGCSGRRTGGWPLIVAVVVIAAGAGVGSILSKVLAPRVTRGFSPSQVVETFYTSMNTLDHQTMQACVVGRAGREQINEATTLYVTSRVTQGYEGRSNVLSAADWDKQGRPKLVSPTTLYGVTGLTLTEERPVPAPVFRVVYDKWNPAPPSDTTAMPSAVEPPKSEGHRISGTGMAETGQGRLGDRQDRPDRGGPSSPARAGNPPASAGPLGAPGAAPTN